MHRFTSILLAAALNVHSIPALFVAPERRFATASFKPTLCQGRSEPTDTVACNIPSLPTTGPITLATPTAPTSWSTPAITATWQVVYSSDVEVRAEPGVDVYDIDVDSSDATFESLKAANKYIICYFSAGTSESFRSDVGCFNHHLGAQDYGCNFGGDFGNEFWLNTSSLEVRKIMQSRIQHAADRGCSAIDPDNIDGYGNRNGIGATEADAIDFVKFLSLEARSRGMGIGLKNLIGITPNLTSDVDFAVNEQCIEFMECDKYSAFFSATIPVFNIEYPTASVTKSWPAAQATARCDTWKSFNIPLLRTNLKNYPTVDCGVSRCGCEGPAPPVPSNGGLPIPSGCVNSS